MTSLADGIRNACEIARRDERKKVIEKSWQWMVDWVFENAPHEVYDKLMSSREEYVKAMSRYED